MRKHISIIVVASLLTLVLPDLANAKAEAWGSCSKLEQKKIFDKKPFHCIKTARGNFVFAPASLPNGSAIDRGQAITSHVDTVIDSTVAKAFSNYDHATCKGGHSNFEATYLTSPTYSPKLLTQQKALFEEAMSCYNNYFDRKVTINIAFATENDYDFLANQLTNGKPIFDDIKLRWIKFMMGRIGSGSGRFAGSAGWSKATDSAWVIMIDSTKSTVPDAHGAAHEFVHILQSYSKSPLFELYGDGAPDAAYVNLPPWFWEGTAELFSYNEMSSSADNFSAFTKVIMSQGKESPTMNKLNSVSDVISTVRKLEAPSDQEANMMNYALGTEFTEYLLATYGQVKYFQIMKNAGTYPDFSENLKSVIGLSKDEFYAKAAPFVLSQWKLMKF